jgi:ribosomal protein S18 acetylase RimI-like enzyme
MKIEYQEIDAGALDLIGPLWQKLNEYHRVRSQHFANSFEKHTFDWRKKDLLEKSNSGSLRIDLAKDLDTGELIGYCVSTISKDKQGEIDSIYVEPGYRQSGIGDYLMRRALRWMDDLSVAKKILRVGAGNEEVFEFHRKYDFYPRTIILEQVRTGETGQM